MPRITFIEHDETIHEITAEDGATVMEVALDNSIPGIDADCGGQCACATCHVFINDDWASKIPAREEAEETMLELAEGVTEFSRLACQIEINDALDGLQVRLPAAQH
ncbi:2Fe-2S iron-sulfur cluster-binding protein [Parasphingorhabdus sp.]|jgi:2Fe-2S ferredoxin|uniref:2Fe-2S iron-sulfur cluster-binding protein n=1 Tax=Parasphingorhabdus sp. TaxID=2709688 RepID=UPI0007F531AF|nr:2Fe-2S ferredoxin [Sphingomonadales bacterium EhC05]